MMTPMIDIVFQLIAFFIFSLSYSPEKLSAQITPPDDDQRPSEALPEAVLIQLGPKGELLLPGGAAPADDERFANGLATLLDKAQHGAPIVVRADRHVRYAAVDRVLAACRKRKLATVFLRLRGQAE